VKMTALRGRERCRSQFGQVGEVPSLVVSDGGLMNRNTSVSSQRSAPVALTGAGCSETDPSPAPLPHISGHQQVRRPDQMQCNPSSAFASTSPTRALTDLGARRWWCPCSGMLADEATIFAEASTRCLTGISPPWSAGMVAR
jgi:hypothetical protein